MKRRIHEFRALYRAWAPHLGRFCAIGYCWWLSGVQEASKDHPKQPPIEGHMKTILHYWGAYKLSRINNTRMGALREMLFKPF